MLLMLIKVTCSESKIRAHDELCQLYLASPRAQHKSMSPNPSASGPNAQHNRLLSMDNNGLTAPRRTIARA